MQPTSPHACLDQSCLLGTCQNSLRPEQIAASSSCPSGKPSRPRLASCPTRGFCRDRGCSGTTRLEHPGKGKRPPAGSLAENIYQESTDEQNQRYAPVGTRCRASSIPTGGFCPSTAWSWLVGIIRHVTDAHQRVPKSRTMPYIALQASKGVLFGVFMVVHDASPLNVCNVLIVYCTKRKNGGSVPTSEGSPYVLHPTSLGSHRLASCHLKRRSLTQCKGPPKR